MMYNVEEVKKGDALYIHSPATGYMKAYAMEDKEKFGLAAFQVAINSETLPGVQEMTINLNTFDVWKEDDTEVLKKIAQQFIKPHLSR